jgi:hypothetical protein
MFCLSALHFVLKYTLIVKVGFALAFQTCTYYAISRLTPLLNYSLSVTMISIIQQFTVNHIILFAYIDGMFQYFSFPDQTYFAFLFSVFEK